MLGLHSQLGHQHPLHLPPRCPRHLKQVVCPLSASVSSVSNAGPICPQLSLLHINKDLRGGKKGGRNQRC